MKLFLIVAALSVVACKTKPVASNGSASPPVPTPAPTPVTLDAAALAPTPAAGGELPLAADVLPADEAITKSRVVVGDGFLYQVPASATSTTHDGVPAESATIEGYATDAVLTFWATSEPFKGDLDALVARETKAATDAKAKEPNVGPVLVFVANDVKQGYGKRMTITFPDTIELRTVVVHEGRAFIHHCSTPNVANAWANVGTDCILRGTTFHIAPPPLAKQEHPVASSAPPPETPNVLFMASKVEGTARPKPTVKEWLDSAAQYIKPCVKDGASGVTFKVTFELGKDGKAGKTSVESGTDNFKPADATVTACVAKVVDGLSIPGTADGVVTPTLLLVVQ